MTVTKNYVARNYGPRDLIIESMGLIAGILAAAFVLLFLAGVLDFGRDISVTVNQPAGQSSAHVAGE